MLETIGNYIGRQANSMYQGSGVQQAVNFGQGLLGQMTGEQSVATPPYVPQSGPVLDPKDVNYQAPATQAARSQSTFTPVAAPELNMGAARPVDGGGVQYAGGIPSLLRSYGEPSVGLLQYIEG
jgi:hypothetical protein